MKRTNDGEYVCGPWQDHAENDEGCYADFAAWERWMSAKVDGSEEAIEAWDGMDLLAKIHLYGLFCDTYRAAYEAGRKARVNEMPGVKP